MALIATASRVVAGSAVIILALSVTGCTSSKHPAATGATSSPSGPTRWWSNTAVTVGSSIDAANPTSAAGKLHPSQADYCGMLKQTLQAGKSVLPSGSASDPKLVTSTEAFLAEIEQVAPVGVSASWHVIGPVILRLVKSGGSIPTASTAVTAQNLQAAEAINTDSKKNCNLDLSSVLTGG